MKYYLVPMVLLAIAISCQAPQEGDTFFPVTKSLNGEKPEIPNKEISAPAIYLIDELMIVHNPFDEDGPVHFLVDINTFEVKAEFGMIGSEPNQIGGSGFTGLNESKRIFYSEDFSRGVWYPFYLDSLLADPNYFPSESLKEQGHMLRSNIFKEINDTIYGNHKKGARLFLKSDWMGGDYGTLGDSFIEEQNYPANSLPKLLSHESLFHPTENIVAVTYRYYDKVDYFTKQGNHITTTHGPNNISPLEKFSQSGKFSATWESDLAYQWSFSTENHIYMAYCGKQRGEMDSNNQLVKAFSEEIHVYDWEGNPVARYQLDRPIETFVVDESTNRIIGTDVSSYEPFVVFEF